MYSLAGFTIPKGQQKLPYVLNVKRKDRIYHANVDTVAGSRAFLAQYYENIIGKYMKKGKNQKRQNCRVQNEAERNRRLIGKGTKHYFVRGRRYRF